MRVSFIRISNMAHTRTTRPGTYEVGMCRRRCLSRHSYQSLVTTGSTHSVLHSSMPTHPNCGSNQIFGQTERMYQWSTLSNASNIHTSNNNAGGGDNNSHHHTNINTNIHNTNNNNCNNDN